MIGPAMMDLGMASTTSPKDSTLVLTKPIELGPGWQSHKGKTEEGSVPNGAVPQFQFSRPSQSPDTL